MGIRWLAIEAKCFDLVVEQSGVFFKCTITETGRGFLFSIFMGWQSARWLSFVVHSLSDGRWSG